MEDPNRRKQAIQGTPKARDIATNMALRRAGALAGLTRRALQQGQGEGMLVRWHSQAEFSLCLRGETHLIVLYGRLILHLGSKG